VLFPATHEFIILEAMHFDNPTKRLLAIILYNL